MVMDTLVCYLLALCFAVAQTEKVPSTTTPTTAPGVNLAQANANVTSNSTVHIAVISNLTESTTPFPSNDTSAASTAATAESTGHLQTSQSTTIMTPLIDSTPLTTTSPGSHTPTFAALTTPAVQTTVGYRSTSDSTGITPAYSSHTVNTTADSVYKTTHGLGLQNSEKYMTIIFSVVLGVFALALVAFMFHKCKHKIQYLHQPLNHIEDTDAFAPDDDTLVISGGLYDGHPIYDNIPTSEDQSQFRLEFLH
ncbi:uncharacterized protein [Pempheris klunzingeri]|uniref:uncharacterized protein n=1 Tax=Pempheris klunzingeri TaxID=3127111 RepID=UPI00398174F6